MPVNPKRYIDKLIKGLAEKGKYYNLSSKRFYSSRTERYCMKYILENVQTKEKLEVYNKLEILKYLVREWSKVTGQPVPEACLAPLNDEKEALSSLEVVEEMNEASTEEGEHKLKTTGVSVLENFKLRGGAKFERNHPKFPNGYKKKQKT